MAIMTLFALSIWTSCVNKIISDAGIDAQFQSQIGPNAESPRYIVNEAQSQNIGFDAGTSEPVLIFNGNFSVEDEDAGEGAYQVMNSIVSAIYTPAGSNRADNLQQVVTALHPTLNIRVMSVEISQGDEQTEPIANQSNQIVNEKIAGFKLVITYTTTA